MEKVTRVFSCKIEEVHSGDDFIGQVDIGVDNLFKRTRIRLAGVDAPNAYKAGPDTTAGKIRDEVKKFLTTGKCSLRLITEGRGGWVSEIDVETPTGTLNINKLLQERGYVYSPNKT